MKKRLFILLTIFILAFVLIFSQNANTGQSQVTWWEFQSIDTMKYSRDVAREKLKDSTFDRVIEDQVTKIAQTGATHVGIATPYDEEFYPILKRWINAARKNNLKVWFRGNWSGWERWFNYPKITRQEHIEKTGDFIVKHKEIFEDGDVFSPCPECENGGPGDPRRSGDVKGHRKFIIEEYNVTKEAFNAIGKNVASNFNSMNGDVARVVMDKETTSAMDGIVAIDHYVNTPVKLIDDIKSISRSSGGKIVLGEFGAPIPDINGKMSEKQQADWIKEALIQLVDTPEVAGVNYWTNTGSSTALWNEDGKAREVVSVLTSVYKAPVIKLVVKDEAGFRVKEAVLSLNGKKFSADSKGNIYLPYFENLKDVNIAAEGYFSTQTTLTESDEVIIVIGKRNPTLIYKILRAIKSTF